MAFWRFNKIGQQCVHACARASVAQGMGSAFSGKAYFLVAGCLFMYLCIFFFIKMFELPKVNIKSKPSG